MLERLAFKRNIEEGLSYPDLYDNDKKCPISVKQIHFLTILMHGSKVKYKLGLCPNIITKRPFGHCFLE
jgi:hypothetical protein